MLLLASCWSYRASKITAVTGGALLIGGVVTGIVKSRGDNGETGDHTLDLGKFAAGTLIVVGLLTLVGGVTGMAIHGPKAQQQQQAPR